MSFSFILYARPMLSAILYYNCSVSHAKTGRVQSFKYAARRFPEMLISSFGILLWAIGYPSDRKTHATKDCKSIPSSIKRMLTILQRLAMRTYEAAR